jgi:ABC-type transport system involved in multi-copper enzyme maturation permease subunit
LVANRPAARHDATRMLANPIIKKELLTQLRSRRAGIMLFAFIVVLCAIVYLLWPQTGVYSLNAFRSREIFTVFLVGQLLMVILFTPAFSASAITIEKEKNSFDLLYTSLLRPIDIICGKLTASISILLLLILSSLPITAVCFLLGGVNASLMLKAYVVIVLTAVSYGLMGLCCSAAFERTFTATWVTYALILVFAALVWLPSLLLSGSMATFNHIWEGIRAASPFSAVFYLVREDLYNSMVRAPTQMDAWATFVKFSIIWSLIEFGIFAALMQFRPAWGETARVRHYEDTRTAVQRRLTWPFYLFDPLRRKRMVRDRANPIFVAELRRRILGRPHIFIRGLTACIAVSILLMIAVGATYGWWSPDTLRVVAIIFQLSLVILIAPSLGASAITTEVESRTLEMLKVSPLAPRRVILGKLRAILWFVTIFLVSSVPMFGAFYYLESAESYWRLLDWAALLIMVNIAFVSIGICCSCYFKSTAAATGAAYGIAGVLCVVTLLSILAGERLSNTAKFWCLVWNPFAAAIQVMCDSLLQYPGFSALWKTHMFLMGGLTVVMLFLALVRFHFLYGREE